MTDISKKDVPSEGKDDWKGEKFLKVPREKYATGSVAKRFECKKRAKTAVRSMNYRSDLEEY